MIQLRRQRHLHELPPRQGARDDLGAHRQPARAGAEMSCEELELSYVCTAQYDAALTLPIAFPPEHLEGTIGEYVSRPRHNAVPRGRDGEIRARHLLPERRRGEAVPGRGARARTLSPKEYPDLRPHPADERRRGQGQARGPHGRGRLRPVCLQLRQLRYGRPHRRDPRRR